MKKLFAVLLGVLVSFLPGCSVQPGPEPGADLVFINDSDAVVVEVVMDFENRFGGARRADCKPLKRGETLGFEAGEYPVTVTVYDAPYGSDEEQEVARLTILEAPPEGERWYISARDGAEGLALLADTVWPAEQK